ncbi:UNVERIFIED_CONTAM: hypothetical protein PYX00_000644 [Menopon gallinae]|uniref:C2H2-type domain-containing protein n=1 Tax=Menopon gallinae TaxID=328185 RepID=A0AAW2IBD1_9NEOP
MMETEKDVNSIIQLGILQLQPTIINTLKTKERQAAKVLKEVGLSEIHWFKKDSAAKYFVCPIESCGTNFLELCLLKNHFFKIHNCRPYKCDFNNCKWSFANKSKLERHKNSHLNMKWFKCLYEACDKMFTTLYNLRQHLKSVHEKAEQFVCSVSDCNAAFHNQRSLDLHKATHTNLERSYSCDIEGCDKSFVTRNALCSHLRSHERKLEDLKCSWEGCNRVFEMPCRLREHMRTHTGEKPYRCDHPGCGWSFYSGSKLHRHRNKHLQVRKFVCCINHCNKSFLRSQHLKEHILTHTKNVKSFTCPVADCDTRFGSRNLVYKHVKKVHRQQSQNSSNVNTVNNEYDMKPSETNNSQILNNQTINQLDTIALLTGDYDICSTENVPLTTQLSELMPSELLVAMTSIDSGNGDSLADVTAMDTPPVNDALVDLSIVETNNNDALVVNDSSVQFVLDSQPQGKSNGKKKPSVSGAARTNYTYKDVVREKAYRTELELNRRNKWHQPSYAKSEEPKVKRSKNMVSSKQTEDLQNCKMSILPDLVLGAPGMSENHSLIVKDELYTQEDLQVLLLDQSLARNSIFEPSTINLRDLE